jgi:hypothetical protein
MEESQDEERGGLIYTQTDNGLQTHGQVVYVFWKAPVL